MKPLLNRGFTRYTARNFGLKMLGRDQARDSHFHGAPHVRAEQTALLGAYTQGVCSS